MKTKTSQLTKSGMAFDRMLTAGNFKPILFSTPMVQAFLRGEKTQERQLCKFHKAYYIFHDGKHEVAALQTKENILPCKYKIGDILWVRETWHHTRILNLHPTDENYGYIYKADNQPWEYDKEWTWKPSILMPKEACRIFFKLKNIRLERLNDISKSDAIAEGIKFKRFVLNGTKKIIYKLYGSKDSWDENPIISYRSFWEQIYGEKSWTENPLVWGYEFERTDASFACS